MIYLIDTIGTETGMHRYDEAFCRALQRQGHQVRICSNFSTDGQRPCFGNFYHGGAVRKVSGLLCALLAVCWLRLRHRSSGDRFVYQSFGLRLIDMLFVLLFCGSRRLVLIAHDVYEITSVDQCDHHRRLKDQIYRHCVPAILCHSHDTLRLLRDDVHYAGRLGYCPHLSYDFVKDVDPQHVGDDIRQLVDASRPNLLFFGQVRATKGIHVLLDAIAQLRATGFDQANIIIAGQDKEHLVDTGQLPAFVRTALRYITDDELNYLFMHTQHILLPYTDIYQSGVLEMVVYFGRHALLSDVPFFREFAQQYPSFCTLYSPNDGQHLAQAIRDAGSHVHAYDEADVRRYKAAHDTACIAHFLYP